MEKVHDFMIFTVISTTQKKTINEKINNNIVGLHSLNKSFTVEFKKAVNVFLQSCFLKQKNKDKKDGTRHKFTLRDRTEIYYTSFHNLFRKLIVIFSFRKVEVEIMFFDYTRKVLV